MVGSLRLNIHYNVGAGRQYSVRVTRSKHADLTQQHCQEGSVCALAERPRKHPPHCQSPGLWLLDAWPQYLAKSAHTGTVQGVLTVRHCHSTTQVITALAQSEYNQGEPQPAFSCGRVQMCTACTQQAA